MKKIEEVKRELERLTDLVAERNKKIKSIDQCINDLAYLKDDLLDEKDDLLSKMTYYLQKEKDLS